MDAKAKALAFSFAQNKEAIFMWTVITHFLCLAAGGMIGIVFMCLLQLGKQADEHMQEMKWRNDN